jgi:phage tail sheath protein FI
MAEKIVSPGVFTRENDLSFVQQGVGAIGAAIVGPTVKGPALIPQKVFSYSDFQALYGDAFKSGSDYYQYFTSVCAREYLKHGGPLTVVRTLPWSGVGSFSNATASSHMAATSFAGVAPSGSETFAGDHDGMFVQYTQSDGTAYLFRGMDLPLPADDTDVIYYFQHDATAGTGPAATLGYLVDKMNAISADTFASVSDATIAPTMNFTSSITAGDSFGTGLGPQARFVSGSTVTLTTNGQASTGSWGLNDGVPKSGSTHESFNAAFQIKTIGDGAVMNSAPPAGTIGLNDVLTVNNVIYGTNNNLRWEIATVNEKKGSFTLIIRRGDDSSKRKVILETFNNCSLDPNATNYVGSIVGTQFDNIDLSDSANPFIQPSGSYPRKSKYVYIDENSIANTLDYLDDNGNRTNDTYTASLPMVSSGSFGGGSDGDIKHPQNFYQDAGTDASNVQGFNMNLNQSGYKAYDAGFMLLKNADEYDINLLMAPGVNNANTVGLATQMINVCEERGDVMTIIDPVPFASTIGNATTEAGERDSSYAAFYWPWVQIADPMTGKYVWVPQSAMMPGIYAFNDKVSAEWFAPAGLNRGGQETVIQAERKLTHANRDELYEANVNPVATFPGEGVVVWGQKTLQKKASALDRVNVRRLLINLKKFIASVSKYLVFENNTAATRNRFLSQVNPYMESVQQRQGLYAFKVVMDESNNTPDIIDRNIMKGDIFIQPAKAAEFIVIDFNIMPTGATFND